MSYNYKTSEEMTKIPEEFLNFNQILKKSKK